MTTESRVDRIERLLALRNRIEADIAALEAEMHAEIAAARGARAAARQASVAVRRRKRAECGTEGGYYRHRRTLNEPACTPCKLAHRVSEANRSARREARSA